MAAGTIRVSEAPRIAGLRFRRFVGDRDHQHLLEITNRSWDEHSVGHLQNMSGIENGYRPSESFDPRRDVLFAESTEVRSRSHGSRMAANPMESGCTTCPVLCCPNGAEGGSARHSCATQWPGNDPWAGRTPRMCRSSFSRRSSADSSAAAPSWRLTGSRRLRASSFRTWFGRRWARHRLRRCHRNSRCALPGGSTCARYGRCSVPPRSMALALWKRAKRTTSVGPHGASGT